MEKTDQIITKGKLTVALQECVCAWTLWREWINDPNYEFNLFFHFNIVQIHYSKTVVCLHYYFLIRRNISEQCACIHAHLLCLDFIFTYLCKCETFKSVVHAIVSELWRVCLKLFFFFFKWNCFDSDNLRCPFFTVCSPLCSADTHKKFLCFNLCQSDFGKRGKCVLSPRRSIFKVGLCVLRRMAVGW